MQGHRFLRTFVIVLLLTGLVLSGAGQGRAVLAQEAVTTTLGPDTSAMSTAFTYQGQLKVDGAPAQGTYRFTVTLWDTAQNGNQMGASESHEVVVTNGIFTVTLNKEGDFGTDAFTGAARWLEIQVCKVGSFPCLMTTLSPRQEITAAPYALSLQPGAKIRGNAYQVVKIQSDAATGGRPAAVTGEMLNALDGVGVYGSNNSTAAGSAGAGVWGRSSNLAGAGVKGTGLNGSAGVLGEGESSGQGIWGRNTTGVAGLFETNSSTAYPQVLLKENADDYARLSFGNSTASKTWTVAGYPSATDANARLNLWYSPIGDVMSLTGSGNVGIGTSAPDEKLVVNGGSALTRIAVDSTGGNAGISLRESGTSRWSVATVGGDLRFFEDYSGLNRLMIKGDGRGWVGIGTNSPTALLDVQAGANTPCAMRVENSGNGGA